MRMNKLYKKIAKKNGVSVAKVKEDIEKAIALSTINTSGKKSQPKIFLISLRKTLNQKPINFKM
ncbi:MAG: hypothetical protein RR992_04235 [Clostridiales bacterium]